MIRTQLVHVEKEVKSNPCPVVGPKVCRRGQKGYPILFRMSYPLIILGAGASFDYIDEDLSHRNKDFKPPLSDGLFNTRLAEEIFKEIPRSIGYLDELSSSVMAVMRNSSKSLEDSLLEIEKRKDERSKIQLVLFRFYIQKLFQKISDEYGRQNGNNYSALFGHINNSGGVAYVVNFNYDLFAEQAFLGEEKREKVQQYINGPIKIIKVHGSCDWVAPIGVDKIFIGDNSENPIKLCSSIPDLIRDSRSFERNIWISRDYIYRNEDRKIYHYPVVSIPVTGNDNSFVCPISHTEALQRGIFEIDRILIIGWKAGDKNLIKFIEDNIDKNKKIPVLLINGGSDYAEDVKKRISHIPNLDIKVTDHGFSSFVWSNDAQNFFNKQIIKDS